MNVLILGSGGREHALAHAVSKSKRLQNLVVIPGNPGMKDIAKCVDIDPMNKQLVKEFCIKQKIDLIIPGSEVFLENGIADTFEDTNVFVFGPNKKAARIESSKEFAKDMMKKYNIPTATYEVFDDPQKAKNYVNKEGAPIVIKYDGLAGGKGVVVCDTIDLAHQTISNMLEEKVYGNDKIIIEEFLQGPEFSFMIFVHNGLIVPMPLAQDHKRLLEDDQGPNTGGMGVYCPVPFITEEMKDKSFSKIMRPIVDALIEENSSFTGFLYGGLMYTDQGPKVIEFNARFGDPETEVILPKLESDILEIIMTLKKGKQPQVRWNDDYYVGVVLASKGYPVSYEKGFEILGLDSIYESIYHMGTKKDDDRLLTNGGRVLLVLGKGSNLQEAKEDAYKHVSDIQCDNLVYRKDIGDKGLKG